MHANIDVHNRRLIAELPADGINCIENLLSHCANMTFADKSRHDRIFKKVTHKGEESAMNYIRIFQNAEALSVSLGNYYLEDQIMHTFMDNFHQGGKYSAQLSSHQAELRREEKITDQRHLSISSLHNDYLNLVSSSGFGRNNKREKMFRQSVTFVEVLITLQNLFSKGSDRKRKKLGQLVIRKTDKRNGCLRNVLDVDLNIT